MMKLSFAGPFVGMLSTAAAVLVGPSAAKASDDSNAFGCSRIEDIPELAMIEGKDGVFFRVMADIRLQHAFTDQTLEHLSALSKALAAHGTTLIYVPVPTKTQALPNHISDGVRLYGFAPEIAQQVYEDIVQRLSARGVAAVDVLTPIRNEPKNEFGELSFFKSDFHWTAHGARLAANAIGAKIKSLPAYADVSAAEFDVLDEGVGEAFSSMRKLLQTHCKLNLPPVKAHTYRTVRKEQANDGSVDIFGANDEDRIALVGTSYSDSPINNFSGFIEYASGIIVENYSISGGNQFGSVLSYFTSREFQEKRPRFVIWENPIYNNLGQYGDAPWKEILAAAANDCRATLASAPQGGLTHTASLKGIKLSANDVVLADAGQDGSRKAVFEFVGADGRVWTRTISRSDRLRSTGRYFASLSGLPVSDFQEVRVTYDGDAPQSSLSICKINLGEQS